MIQCSMIFHMSQNSNSQDIPYLTLHTPAFCGYFGDYWCAIYRQRSSFPWHDAWKHFLPYWPFVRGIHQSWVESPHEEPTNVELWFLLWWMPEQSVQQTMELTMIWDTMMLLWRLCYGICSGYSNGPEASREAGWGSEFVPLKKRRVESFILLHKISRTACCFGIRTFLKWYKCCVSATIWYTDHQYLAQYSEIINNRQEIALIFCNYAVSSCGTWCKGPSQSPCNVLSISDLELYVTETSTRVCDPVTD